MQLQESFNTKWEVVEDKVLIFLCESAANHSIENYPAKFAARLAEMKIVYVGNLEMLSEQHSAPVEARKKMLFINDCRSGCVRVLTHGFHSEQYLFLDVSAHSHSTTFDLDSYIISEVLPKINEQWNS